LIKVFDAYRVLNEKMKSCRKPIFPVLPSVLTASDEVAEFLSFGRVNFPDEALLGEALCKVYHNPAPAPVHVDLPDVDHQSIRRIINSSDDGYLAPEKVQVLLDSAGIPRVGEGVFANKHEAVEGAEKLGFPVVMKVVGPVHKSDVNGVVLNVEDAEQVEAEFDRMIKIPDTTAILIQPMISGIELFAGAKFEPKFGHLILCGMGGIFIEVLKDVSTGLAPLSTDEALQMIRGLKSYKIIQGIRGRKGINENQFVEILRRLSALVSAAPEIMELDLNPLLGNADRITAVDARIRIEK
jgi:hypothetical protein